jgi:hypothetical protein
VCVSDNEKEKETAGVALRKEMDAWCKGGIVWVDVGEEKRRRKKGGKKQQVDLLKGLKEVVEAAKEGGYVIGALSDVCPEVARMVLPVEE